MPVPPHPCEALVLRHIDYGEADRIVSLLTAEHGLQKGFARAARKSRKRFGSALEPFSGVVVHWQHGKGGTLWDLREVELLDARAGLRSDFELLSLASYGVELIELLLEEGEPQQQIYELLGAFLDFLNDGGDRVAARLLLELRLVYLLGYVPHLLHCSECLKIFHDEPVRFEARRGGSLCLGCAGQTGLQIGLGTIGSLARSLKVSHRQFAGFRFGPRTRAEAGAILEQVLRQVLPREPKTIRFLDPHKPLKS
jgi:DNA repair protein RecO (recombination protein O)